MNERIKELARLAQNATATHFGDRWSSIGRAEFMMIYNQKFAELLVKECIQEFEDVKVADHAHDKYDAGYDAGLQQAIEVIKQHFGVE